MPEDGITQTSNAESSSSPAPASQPSQAEPSDAPATQHQGVPIPTPTDDVVFRFNEDGSDFSPKSDKTSEETEVNQTPEPAKAQPSEQRPRQADGKFAARPSAPRDYSVFSESDRPYLENMDNRAFDYLKVRLPELYKQEQRVRELEGQLTQAQTAPPGSSAIDHPDGFMLSDMYRQTATAYSQANTKEQHYQEQIALARSGQPITIITGFDEHGRAQYSNPIDPSTVDPVKLEVGLQRLLNDSSAERREGQRNINQLREVHRQSYDAQLNAVNQERARRFEWVADPSKLKTITIEGFGNGEKVVSEFISMLPPAFKKSMPSSVGADLYLALAISRQKERKLENDNKVRKTQEGRLQKVEPPVGNSGSISSRNPQDDTKINWNAIEV
jgi:hypothetical protein